jgi:heparanase
LFGLPLLGVTEFARQSLAGASYALLTNDVFDPNPDYFAALAYSELVSPEVLSVSTSPASSSDSIHVYAQCAADSFAGGVAISWVNIDTSTAFEIDIAWVSLSTFEVMNGTPSDSMSSILEERLEYHFAPLGGDVHSRVLTLNGLPLAVTGNSPPPLVPARTNISLPLLAMPLTFGYAIVYPGNGGVCSHPRRLP